MLVMSGRIKSITINRTRRVTVEALDEFIRAREAEAAQLDGVDDSA